MARFIRLDRKTIDCIGAPPRIGVLVNVDQITAIFGLPKGAKVQLVSGQVIGVEQTFEEVQALLCGNPEQLGKE